MPTASVRKFAISPTPGEVLDFTEDLSWFDSTFAELGFGKTSTYVFRHQDRECMIKAELVRGPDGFICWLYVQAMDEHAYRAKEIAEALGAHLVEKTRA